MFGYMCRAVRSGSRDCRPAVRACDRGSQRDDPLVATGIARTVGQAESGAIGGVGNGGGGEGRGNWGQRVNAGPADWQ